MAYFTALVSLLVVCYVQANPVDMVSESPMEQFKGIPEQAPESVPDRLDSSTPVLSWLSDYPAGNLSEHFKSMTAHMSQSEQEEAWKGIQLVVEMKEAKLNRLMEEGKKNLRGHLAPLTSQMTQNEQEQLWENIDRIMRLVAPYYDENQHGAFVPAAPSNNYPPPPPNYPQARGPDPKSLLCQEILEVVKKYVVNPPK